MNETNAEQPVACPRCRNQMTQLGKDPAVKICWWCDAEDGAAAAGVAAAPESTQDRVRLQRAGSGAVGGGGRTRKGYVFGKLILTTCMQAQGAPIVDSCSVNDAEGRRYKGWAILLKPWRRDKYGASEIQPALVVGWRQRQNAKLTDSAGSGATKAEL